MDISLNCLAEAVSTNIPNICFFGALNTMSLNISSNLSHIELRIRSIYIAVIMSFVVTLNISIKRVDCSNLKVHVSPNGLQKAVVKL